MICTCNKCLYTFAAEFIPDTCPDCGSRDVREATGEEKDWYYDLEIEKQHNPLLLDRTEQKVS